MDSRRYFVEFDRFGSDLFFICIWVIDSISVLSRQGMGLICWCMVEGWVYVKSRGKWYITWAILEVRGLGGRN